MTTEDDDNAALVPRRINRNSRIREARLEAAVVIDRANNKLGQVMREQYPDGTAVVWKRASDPAIQFGLALRDNDNLFGPYLWVCNNETSEYLVITAEELLAGGDREY